VLRPHSSGASWTDPADVALVVEVESVSTRRYDRLIKAALYAEAGIASYWRVEPNRVVLYRLGAGGTYAVDREIADEDLVATHVPYPIRLAPSTWV
jgi:Uma2 family endonuclease